MAANMILPAEPIVFYTVSPPPAAPPAAPAMCLPPPQALFPLVGTAVSPFCLSAGVVDLSLSYELAFTHLLQICLVCSLLNICGVLCILK